MVVVVDRGLRVVYDAQIKRRQMSVIPFHLLVRARYLYIYIPNSIIFLNTSDSIGLQQSLMHDSDGV
jgi:hypothetical protein